MIEHDRRGMVEESKQGDETRDDVMVLDAKKGTIEEESTLADEGKSGSEDREAERSGFLGIFGEEGLVSVNEASPILIDIITQCGEELVQDFEIGTIENPADPAVFEWEGLKVRAPEGVFTKSVFIGNGEWIDVGSKGLDGSGAIEELDGGG